LEHVGSMLGECTPSRVGLVVRGRVRGVDVALSKTLGLGLGSGVGEGTFHIRKVRCGCAVGGCALRLEHVGRMLGKCTLSRAVSEVVRGQVRVRTPR
jgi:hypothetical protein